MTKTAIFVEGQTELIFVREFLLRHFEYENVAVGCFELFTDYNLVPAEYEYSPPNAENYFEIINVGMDGNVLTRLLRRESFLWKAGFQKAIGLRDMYSKAYRDLSKANDALINRRFIDENANQINRLAIVPSKIFFHFAIMEIESWILGLYKHFVHVDARLTPTYISNELGFDLTSIDPDSYFFHPADELAKIYALGGLSYNKSKGDVNSIMSKIEKEDLANLYIEPKCPSYSEFINSLVGPIAP